MIVRAYRERKKSLPALTHIMLGALGNVIRALGNVDSALETLERGPEQLEQQIGDELHRRALAHFDPVSVAEKQATKQGRSKVAG